MRATAPPGATESSPAGRVPRVAAQGGPGWDPRGTLPCLCLAPSGGRSPAPNPHRHSRRGPRKLATLFCRGPHPAWESAPQCRGEQFACGHKGDVEVPFSRCLSAEVGEGAGWVSQILFQCFGSRSRWAWAGSEERGRGAAVAAVRGAVLCAPESALQRPRAAEQVREAHAVSSASDFGPSLGACFRVQSWDRPWPWRHTASLVSDCSVAPLASSINF